MKSISLICRDLVPYENVLKLKPKWKHFWKWIWAKPNCMKLLLPVWITVESFYRLCQSFGEILYGLLCDPNIHIFAPFFFSLAMMMTREMNKCVHFSPHLRFVAANTICLLTYLQHKLSLMQYIQYQYGGIHNLCLQIFTYFWPTTYHRLQFLCVKRLQIFQIFDPAL